MKNYYATVNNENFWLYLEEIFIIVIIYSLIQKDK